MTRVFEKASFLGGQWFLLLHCCAMESGYDEVSLLGINYCGWFVTPSRWLESSRNTDEHSKMMLHLLFPAFPQHPPVKSSLSCCLKASKGVRLQKFSYLRLLLSPCLTKSSQPVITMYYLLSECFPGHLWTINTVFLCCMYFLANHIADESKGTNTLYCQGSTSHTHPLLNI